MWKRLKENYREKRAEYMRRSPRGKWEYTRNIGIFFLTLSGVSVLDPNYKVIWYSYVPGFVCMDILISFFYTIWYFIDTPITGILVTPTFGVVIPVR